MNSKQKYDLKRAEFKKSKLIRVEKSFDEQFTAHMQITYEKKNLKYNFNDWVLSKMKEELEAK